MNKETAINLLENIENYVIVLASIEGRALRNKLTADYYYIINRKATGKESEIDLQLWKFHQLQALRKKILNAI